jgi:drug/metabolite transporter (DMT)-like permease
MQINFRQPSPYLVLVIGLTAVSTASLFIRFTQATGTPSLAIAAIRLIMAAAIITPITLRRHLPDIRALSRRDLVLALASGALLALHFASWITSLEHVSVMVSVVLVTTNPIWVALFAPFLIGEKIDRRTLIGIGIAFVGGILVSIAEGGSTATNSNPLLGSGLAVVGAIAAALYMIIGRRLRASLSLLPYIWLVYTTAAVVLLITVLIVGTPLTGYAPVSYFWMLLLALIPQLIGHSSFNYALAHVSAAFVSLVTLAEPIGSALLAFIFLGEVPGWVQVIGAGLILSAVVIAQQSQPDLAENTAAAGD